MHTGEVIRAELDRLGIPYETVGDYGIIGRIETGRPGKTLLLRSDMDALPTQEAEENLRGEKSCVSKIPGVGHLCGHDGRMASVAAFDVIVKGVGGHGSRPHLHRRRGLLHADERGGPGELCERGHGAAEGRILLKRLYSEAAAAGEDPSGFGGEMLPDEIAEILLRFIQTPIFPPHQEV